MNQNPTHFRLDALVAALSWRGGELKTLIDRHPDAEQIHQRLAEGPLPVALVMGREVRAAWFPLPSWRNVPGTGLVGVERALEFYVARRQLSARAAKTEPSS